MNEIKVYETKIPFIVGIIDMIIFTLFLLFFLIFVSYDSSILEIIIYITIFSSFDLLGLFLILSYYNRKLIIYPNYISYTTTFNNTHTFYLQDINIIESKRTGSFHIISKDNKKLASFESNMINAKKAIQYFHENAITFYEKKIDNTAIQLENQYIKSKWNQKQIKKEAKIVKIINYFLSSFIILSILLPSKIGLSIMLFTVLFFYFIYLYLYPKMTFNYSNKKKVNRYHIAFPFLSTLLSMWVLIMISITINSNIIDFFTFVFIYSIILSIPYFFILIIRKRKERISKILLVIGSVFIISFSTTHPLNNVLTFKPSKHELVKVLDKEKHHLRRFNHYYLKVNRNGEIEKIEISSKLYKTVNINDNVKICMRESIFHFQYYVVHN